MFCFGNFDPSPISTMEKGKQVTWGCGFDGRLDLGEWMFEGHLDIKFQTLIEFLEPND